MSMTSPWRNYLQYIKKNCMINQKWCIFVMLPLAVQVLDHIP